MAEITPLEKLEAAVQEFANEMAETPVIVSHAIVCWEQVRFDEHGSSLRAVRYATVAGESLSGTLGLLEGAREFVRRDILGIRTDVDDDD